MQPFLRRHRLGVVLTMVALLAVAAVGGGTSYILGPGHGVTSLGDKSSSSGRSSAPAKPRGLPPAPQPVLAPVTADVGPGPKPRSVAARLARDLTSPDLGSRIAARVTDLTTGAVLLDHRSAATTTPASTTKILTAVAALSVLGPDFRFSTTVVAGTRPGEVVLVGGGDPTLSAAAGSTAAAYPGAARLTDLAAQVRAARAAGSSTSTRAPGSPSAASSSAPSTPASNAPASGAPASSASASAAAASRPPATRATPPITRVLVDAARFSGPQTAPGWDGDDVSGGYVAPIAALMVDGGRVRPGYTPRSTDPARAAGVAFAAALGLPPGAVSTGTPPPGARVLATVHSAPLAQILRQMLTVSDNTLAECIGRQVALTSGRPGSFTGAASAVRAAVGRLGVPASSIRLSDTSGLSRYDAIAPVALTGTLQAAASTAHPPLHLLFSDLPVGGYRGTLADRFKTASSDAAAGQVRAKTGTLTGVSTLAGIVTSDSGAVFAFAFLADRVPATGSATLNAEAALDRLAADLAGCGCQ